MIDKLDEDADVIGLPTSFQPMWRIESRHHALSNRCTKAGKSDIWFVTCFNFFLPSWGSALPGTKSRDDFLLRNISSKRVNHEIKVIILGKKLSNPIYRGFKRIL